MSKGDGGLSKSASIAIWQQWVSELNRQQQVKETKVLEARFKEKQQQTERLRKIKIEIVDGKRKKAMQKKQKHEAELEKRGYRDACKAILDNSSFISNPKNKYDSYSYFDSNRQKWLHDQHEKQKREEAMKVRETKEVHEWLNKLSHIENKQEEATKRYQKKLVNKTYGGREDYQRTCQRKKNLEIQQKDFLNGKLQDYLEKQDKHNEAMKLVNQHKRWEKQQKMNKEQKRLDKVHENQQKLNKVRNRRIKLLKRNKSFDNSEMSVADINNSRQQIVNRNKERLKRQLEYKKCKVLIKHAKGLTDRLKSKIEIEAKAQNLQLSDIGAAHSKMEALLKKSKFNSKSMRSLVGSRKLDIWIL